MNSVMDLASTATEQFAKKHGFEGLTAESIQGLMAKAPGYTPDKAKKFLAFHKRIKTEMLQHPIIQKNQFCEWFAQGEMSQTQLKYFIVQFSVFSNLFLIAQLLKVINADSMEGMRASKEILANELGVVFHDAKQAQGSDRAIEDEEGRSMSIHGTVDGGTFRFQAAHFEWLLRLGAKLDLGFNDMGKRSHGTKSTLFFCDELQRLYGSDHYQMSQASSYAVENWAAAGFWDQLIQGFEGYNKKNNVRLPLSFFTWHAKIEAQHAAHTQEELEELYFTSEINEDEFIHFGREMLDGVAVFWQGLYEDAQNA